MFNEILKFGLIQQEKMAPWRFSLHFRAITGNWLQNFWLKVKKVEFTVTQGKKVSSKNIGSS